MGLRDTLSALVQTTLTVSIGDIASQVTFNSITTGTYDPVGGTAPVTSVPITCTGLLANLDQKLVNDESLIATGRKLLVPSVQLAGVSVDALDDRVTVAGTPWVIKEVRIDPSGALYTFILAAASGVQVGG